MEVIDVMMSLPITCGFGAGWQEKKLEEKEVGAVGLFYLPALQFWLPLQRRSKGDRKAGEGRRGRCSQVLEGHQKGTHVLLVTTGCLLDHHELYDP